MLHFTSLHRCTHGGHKRPCGILCMYSAIAYYKLSWNLVRYLVTLWLFNRFWIRHSLSQEQVRPAFHFLWIVRICCTRNTAGAEIRREMRRRVEHVSVTTQTNLVTIMGYESKREMRENETRRSETSSRLHCVHQPPTHIRNLRSLGWQHIFKAISLALLSAQGLAKAMQERI